LPYSCKRSTTQIDPISRSGYTLAACSESDVFGTATFLKDHATWSAIAVCPENSLLEWTATEVEGVTISGGFKVGGARGKTKKGPL